MYIWSNLTELVLSKKSLFLIPIITVSLNSSFSAVKCEITLSHLETSTLVLSIAFKRFFLSI